MLHRSAAYNAPQAVAAGDSMKLYTKTGDQGQTGLLGGARVAKDDPRVHGYGEVDELNAAIGWVVAAQPDGPARAEMYAIQGDLFLLGAQLASDGQGPPKFAVTDAEVARLEGLLDRTCAGLPALRNFVLPGGCELAARLHLARTICRRAERAVTGLVRAGNAAPVALAYLNRLSDLLFALALAANRQAGVGDITWSAP